MKNNKKIILLLYIIGFVLLVFGFSFLLDGDIRIYEFNADVTLTDKGDMEVVERWDMKYFGDYNVRFRNIKYGKYNSNNPLYQEPDNIADFNTIDGSYSVKVYNEDHLDVTGRVGYSFNDDIDELGEPLKQIYHTNEEVLFVDMSDNGGLKGRYIIEYKYTIIGAITQYSDVSELNWRFVDYAEAKIKKSTITINLPNNDLDKENLLAWGHGLSRGNINIVDNKTIKFEMEDIRVDDSERIEVRLLTDNSLFNSIMDYNKVLETDLINKNIIVDYENNLAEETNLRIKVANIILYSSIGIVIIMSLLILYIFKKYDKEYEALFNEKYLYAPPSDLTPAQMSYLFYFEKTNNEDITATLLDLIRRKYLKIVLIDEFITDEEASFKLVLNKDKSLEDLLPHEAHLIYWFISKIGDGTSVLNKTIEQYGSNYTNAEIFNKDVIKFKNLVKKSCEDLDFFENRTKDKIKIYKYVLIPLMAIFITVILNNIYNIAISLPIIFLIIISVIYIIYVSSIKKRSVNGNEEFVKWNAFKRFLVDFGSFKDYPMPGIIVWEKYLVFATSFKIADLVMKQLEVKLPQIINENNSTYLIYSYPKFHIGFMMFSLNRTMTTAQSTIKQTVIRHNQSKSSGFGSGGGFSGGSSFGGGGGGGFSR
ncbi:MAG: DUF2207 domain-containing protein [Bacilli bacterium]